MIRNEFILNDDNFLVRDHQIYNVRILPGVCLLDAVLRAYGPFIKPVTMTQILFKQPIALGKGEARRVQITIQPDKQRDFVCVSSLNSANIWIEHLTAFVEKTVQPEQSANLHEPVSGVIKTVNMNELYTLAANWGIKHGEFMRAEGLVQLAENQVCLSLRTNKLAGSYSDKFILHPTLLDAATFSALALRYEEFISQSSSKAYIPIYIEEMTVFAPLLHECVVEAKAIPSDHDEMNKLDIVIRNTENALILVMRNFQNKRINQQDTIIKLLNHVAVNNSTQASGLINPLKNEYLPTYLRQLFSELLGKPVSESDINHSFFDLGLDSMGLVSAVEQIEQQFQVDLYPTLLFEKNTMQKLQDYLIQFITPSTVKINPSIKPSVKRELVYLNTVWVETDEINAKTNLNCSWLILSNHLSLSDINLPDTKILKHHELTVETLEAWRAGQHSQHLHIINLLPIEEPLQISQQLQAGFYTIHTCLNVLVKHSDITVNFIHCYAIHPMTTELGEMTSGLAKSLSSEVSHIHFKAIGIEDGQPFSTHLLARLVRECSIQTDEIAIRYQLQRRLVKKFQRMSTLPSLPSLTLHHRGFYVITGGLGEIAKHLATYLMTRYDAEVLLLGRRLPGHKESAWLHKHSAHLKYQRVDVGDEAAVSALFRKLAQSKPKIDGIFHTAGVLADRLFADTTTDDIKKIFHAKVMGTYHLAKMTDIIPVDFIMLFSSLSSILGNIGQSAYSAANSFLDGFANHHSHAHCKWISVNWPLWKEGGMRLSSAQQEKLETQWGLFAIDNEEAFRLIEDALSSGMSQLIPLPEKALALIENELLIEDNTHDIAIIGLAGQYPDADDVDEYWQNILHGKDCISDLSKRFADAPYGWSGLLRSIKNFDAGFFHISPADAKCMDPQERLFLQTAWSCLENAGYSATHTRENDNVGVYVGAMFGLYQLHGITLADKSKYPDSSFASLANRVSYSLNLTGPSFTLDSMCSSSFTALHIACQQLRANEVSMALVGGVNVISHPAKYNILLNKHFLASKGRCIAFGKGGDGYVPGEGVGAVLLKPLHKAIKDRDFIYAVIKSTAINHGGHSAGYTVPSAKAQSQVIAAAISQASVAVEDVLYIEAHGTGTSLGDPIEIAALQECYGRDSSKIWLGSVKSNIGHLESASGMAALAKVLLQYQFQTLVPTLHGDELNPGIDFAKTSFKLVNKPVAFANKAVTAISCFGAGGSNAHVILSSPPLTISQPNADKVTHLFCFSAKTESSLKQYLLRFVKWLQTNENRYSLSDISFTLNQTRDHFQFRWATTAVSAAELIEKMVMNAVPDKGDIADQYLSGKKPHPEHAGMNKNFFRVPLPAYAFAEEEHWIIEAAKSSQYFAMQFENMPLHSVLVPPHNVIMIDENHDHPDYVTIHPQHLPERLEPDADYIYCVSVDPADGGAFNNIIKNIEMIASCLVNPLQHATAVNLILLTESSYHELAFCLLGAINSLNSQYPGIKFQLIDKDKFTPISTIIAERSTATAHRIYSYRNGQRIIPCFNEGKSTLKMPFIKTKGVYLLTGGLGEIGYPLALSLAKQDKISLILTGRRPTTHPDIVRKLAVLNQHQAIVTYIQCDITNHAAVYTLKKSILDNHLDCHGILHLAGEMPATMINHTVFIQPNSPKIRGTQLLDVAFAECHLDWFIIFGSLSSLAGLPGAVSYALENGYLNGFISQREQYRLQQQRHGKTVVINWPLWEGTAGAGISQEKLDQWNIWSAVNQGLQPLSFQQGLNCLYDIVTQQESGIYFPFIGDELTYHTYLHSLITNKPKNLVNSRKINIKHDCRELVISLIEEILELDRAKISPALTWLEMGFDSISLADFASKLSFQQPVAILPTHLFTHSTVEELVLYLSQHGPTKTANNIVKSEPLPIQQADDIVIVGIAAKLPQTDHHDDLWFDLVAGRSLYSEVPADRWYAENSALRAGFINDATCFDPEFFGILPVDARLMDPQQRLLLQSAWQAIEDAGQDPLQLSGQSIGVFIGAQFNEYQTLLMRDGCNNIASVTGNAHTFLANRISSFLDITGPSEMVDTACSSSMVALHRAYQAILNEECQSALVGGVSLFLDPDTLSLAKNMGIISADNICRPFDQAANGYVKGEGVISVWLMRKSIALQRGYPVYGVIKGSGCNHNGKSTSLTSPNVSAQKKLLLDVYRKSNIPIETISYWEAHGTGTVLGDPLEIQAVLEAYLQLNTKLECKTQCAIGSIKANIGHLEPASGLAGIVKVLLMFKHKVIPQQANYNKLNNYIDLSGSHFYIPEKNAAWEPITVREKKIPRRAGVSSFGFGGTNAHIILEEFVAADNPARLSVRIPYHLIVLSAKSKHALQQKSRDLLSYIISDQPDLKDLAFTLSNGRSHFIYRHAWIVSSIDQLVTSIETLPATLFDTQHQTSQGLLSQSGHMLDELQTYLINRLQTENLIDVEYQNTLQALAELYCHGNHVDFSRLYNNSECQRLSLPVYPFQRLPLWYKEIEMEMSSEPLAGFYRPSWVPCTNTSDFTNIDQIIYLVANSATATLAESIQALLPANMAIITQCDDIHHIVFNKPCQIWYLADMAQSSNGHTGASMSKEVELIMQFFQALLESGHLTSPLNIKVITSNVYRIIGNDALHFAGASMHGLCQVAAKEYQHWQVGAIDVVSEELNDHHLLQCIFSTESRLQASYAIRGLVKYRQMLSSVPFAPTVAKHAFVKKGVYMLLGGAGRIGLTLCEHLVKNYSATVILIGRSKLTPAKKQQLAKLKRWPGNVIYQQVDITDEPAFKSTLLSLQETYKHFSGIFHTAMQYTETSLQHLTAEPLRQAIAVKVSPLKILHFMRHELSFDNVIVFSSAQSFHGNALRGAYTAACNVQDNLCDYLSVDMPIIVVNWGFWELASAPLNSQLHEYGITPINSRSGMKALEIMLNHAEKQIAFMQISPEIVKLMDISSGQSSIPVACGEAQSLHEDNIILQLQGLEELDEVIIKWLYLKFKMIGLLNDPSKQYSLTTLSQQLSVDDKGRVLLHSIFKLLAKCGYLKMIGETYMLVGEKVNSLTQTSDEEIQLEKCHLTRRYQVIEAHINLAYLCVQNIFAVLTRQRLATDVIFPGARSVLVDQIYMNNPLSDYFNLQVSETVFNYLKNFPDKSISILEIGTGTGATTQSVFKRLSTGLHQKIDYHLTDISEAILSNSRQHIVTPPALSTHYATLDISQNPSLQGFTSEQFDIIIASNVVHATKDLSVSIRHIKQLLKKGGALVLNECVTHSHFLSLTFGLLDGWWHYNDKSLRSDAGPLLSQSQWCNLLESHGFKTDVISDSLCNDQKVLISISDGLVAESETQRLSAASLATLTNTDIVTFNHTEQSILDFIADCLELDRKKIQHDTKLAALGIDSISAINLISALNTRYKLQFSIAELLQAENIKNLLSKMYNNNIIREVSA